MAKGKRKNQNKNTDVVEQVAKEDAKQQNQQVPQPDPVKESTQQQPQPTQQSLSEPTPNQESQKVQQKVQQPQVQQPTTVEPVVEETKEQPVVEVTSVQPDQSPVNDKTHDDKKIADVPVHAEDAQVLETKTENQEKKAEQVPQNKGQDAQVLETKTENQEKKAEQVPQNKGQDAAKQQHKEAQEDTKIVEVPVHAGDTQVLENQKVQQQAVVIPESQPVAEPPKEQVVQATKQTASDPVPPVLIEQAHQQSVVQQSNPQLQYRNELEDGLKLVAGVMDQFVYQNPLAHEQEAHGNPQFSQNFDPAAFHLIERILQQNRQSTPEKEKQGSGSRSRTPPKDHSRENQQALQEIKQSAESIDPDPLELQTIIPDQQKAVSILKSMHSDSDEESKNKEKLRRMSEESGKSSKRNSKAAVLHPPQNPTYTNPIPPIPQVQNPKTNEIISEKALDQPKKDLDFDEINKEMLKQRQIEWKKMQQRELQPRIPSVHLARNQPETVQSPPVIPHAPERLPYTNNLPIISQVRNKEEKDKLKNEANEIKEKIEENQKLRKQIHKDNPWKKIGVATAISAACLGACILGKAEKKIVAGASIASFVMGYLMQK